MGFDREIEMIKLAAERELLTAPYVFDAAQAAAMAQVGVDILVPHPGLTTEGSIGAKTAISLDAAVDRIQETRDAAVAVAPTSMCCATAAPSPSRTTALRPGPDTGNRRVLRRFVDGTTAHRTRHR
ncbi:Phosphoenolpyruvate hydrolase-like [Streptomyces sp. MnatMP-M27]|uniref:phosphoenolpyruvate hydrolase family protein n=1 Tax=Streptomyces sp. MnatMP-M27 TaxID=1839768 RepID=UPI00081F16A3|nr:phosphoenolpyruvate hydrolase family protein [Streptomyces sp. MnatMP-M27]SCF85203.1 Phosphoenolpyruvate hydrolase-like [Streptomyces sp. MnatMP-M27]